MRTSNVSYKIIIKSCNKLLQYTSLMLMKSLFPNDLFCIASLHRLLVTVFRCF